MAIALVTPAVLRAEPGGRSPDATPAIGFPVGPVLPRSETPFALDVIHVYSIVRAATGTRDWHARTMAYFYSFAREDGREILACHWRLDGQSHITTPHIHLGSGAQIGWQPLMRAHLPTGAILLPDVIELAITLGARPPRTDWPSVLRNVRSALAAA